MDNELARQLVTVLSALVGALFGGWVSARRSRMERFEKERVEIFDEVLNAIHEMDSCNTRLINKERFNLSQEAEAELEAKYCDALDVIAKNKSTKFEVKEPEYRMLSNLILDVTRHIHGNVQRNEIRSSLQKCREFFVNRRRKLFI